MIRPILLTLCLLALPVMARAQQQYAVPPLITAQTVAPAPAMAPSPVVMELFTSQGCAYCPPADKLMGQMTQQPGVIGLSCHVDYFGVRSHSLGKGFCTQRQNDYRRLIGKGPRYTPELVVNGHMDMIGSEAGKVSAAILKARGEKIFPITLVPVGSDAYNFSLPAASLEGQNVHLWMAVFDRPHSLAITEGGNLGKTITYYNVVSRMNDLGVWNGQPMAQSVNPSYTPDNEGIAIIAQNESTGRIIGAGSIKR